mgnify:CR=1 FL=1
MKMPEYFSTLTDNELLQHILFMLSTLVVMRICEWTVTACKWIYGWIGSMFPTSIDKR